jgi:hypothetical protein
MQEFFINKGSVNPVLRMELVCDGRFDYKKSYIFNHAIEDASVTFSMINRENNQLKISKSKAEIVEVPTNGCETKHLLQYSWKPRDVKEAGTFKAWFEITFNGDIKEEGMKYPTGNLIVPIEEELIIYIN